MPLSFAVAVPVKLTAVTSEPAVERKKTFTLDSFGVAPGPDADPTPGMFGKLQVTPAGCAGEQVEVSEETNESATAGDQVKVAFGLVSAL